MVAPWNEVPRYLIRDRDRVYGAAVAQRLRAMCMVPSFHGRSSVVFTTNIAESDFRYTQGEAGECP
jgi:hypothetical protein